jgi:oligo-1,6-glucosidase
MQWNDSPYGGFSTVEPWMRVPEDHKYCNVAQQLNAGDSILAFWMEMLALRKELDDVLVCASEGNKFARAHGSDLWDV